MNNLVQLTLLNQLSNSGVNLLKYNIPRVIDPIKSNLNEYVQKNIACYFEITGHYDSYISKSCTAILWEKYLSKKYDGIIKDVDPAFALCTASINKVKKKVTCFPEYVNRTLAPGIYSLIMDADKTRMIVIKEPMIGKDDRSENGITNTIVHFSTRIIFIGKNKMKWMKVVRKQIDDLVSSISKTDQGDNRIRYKSMSSAGEEQSDIKVRPMNLLSFPQKDHLLAELNEFVSKADLYKELQVPHRFGMLLYGKPGTGKTAFAFSLAQHLEMDCVSVNLDHFDKQNGDNAFSQPNTIYIIDEIDSQLVNRAEMNRVEVEKSLQTSRRLLQLLRAIDNMSGGSIVIATTNYEEKLDPALKRSGRFDRLICMDDLDENFTRKMIEARGADADAVIDAMLKEGKSYPFNPAELENKIIFNIMMKNDIGTKSVASMEELGLDAVEEIANEPENFDEGKEGENYNDLIPEHWGPDVSVGDMVSVTSSSMGKCVIDDEDDDED